MALPDVEQVAFGRVARSALLSHVRLLRMAGQPPHPAVLPRMRQDASGASEEVYEALIQRGSALDLACTAIRGKWGLGECNKFMDLAVDIWNEASTSQHKTRLQVLHDKIIRLERENEGLRRELAETQVGSLWCRRQAQESVSDRHRPHSSSPSVTRCWYCLHV